MRRLSRIALFWLAFVLGLGLGPVEAGPPRPTGGSFALVPRAPVKAANYSADLQTSILASRTVSGGFNLVGVTLPATDQVPAVEVRTREAGSWGPWQPLEIDPDEGQDGVQTTIASQPLWVGDADAVQARATGPNIERLAPRINVHWVRSKGNARTILVPGAGLAGKVASAATTQPEIITRAAWGADESLRQGGPSYSPPLRIAIVHHTAGTNSYSPDESDDVIRGIYYFHVVARDFSDIGYNFLIDRYGKIFEGRFGGITKVVHGAHAGGFNTGTTGIALMGTFDSAGPTPEMEDALTRLIARKLDIHHVDPSAFTTLVSAGSTRYPAGTQVTLANVSSHRDVSTTACPGSITYGRLPPYRDQAYNIGLPKIFEPGFLPPFRPGSTYGYDWGRLSARLSQEMGWQVSLNKLDGTPARQWNGTGTSVNFLWDGNDPTGKPLNSNIYSLRLTAGGPSGEATPYSVSLPWVRSYPDGILLKGSSNRISLLREGTLIPINSPAVFESNYSWTEFVTVPASLLARYPQARQPFREGTLIGTPDGAAWAVSNRLRRRVPTENDFTALGYSWTSVRWISWEEAAWHQIGDPLTAGVTHPDGTLVKGAGDIVFLLENGTKRPVTSDAIFDSRFRRGDIVLVTDAELALYPSGSALGFRDGTLIETPDNKVWLISDGARRYIPSITTFNSLGFAWSNVRKVSAPEASIHPAGDFLGSAHPDGVLLKGSGSQVWIVSDGTLVPISSPSAFESNFNWAEIVTISDTVIARYASAQQVFRDGTLIRTPDGKVWAISRGLRRHVSTEQDFNRLGYSWSNVRWVSFEEGAIHQLGAALTANGTHPDGTLVRGSGPAVFVLEDGQRRWVSSENVLSSRFRWAEVIVIPDAELALYPEGSPLGFRNGTLIGAPDGKVWFISRGLRRHVPTEGAFAALGFSWSNVRWVSNTEIALHGQGTPLD